MECDNNGVRLMSLKEKYDSFQKPAVQAIVRDFTRQAAGRFLLVIPTGGGKTFTAVKSVCALFDSEELDVSEDKVLWVAHRTELLTQAKDTFKKFLSENSSLVDLDKNIVFSMVPGQKKLRERMAEKQIKLAVIDEAHHSAAASYQIIMSNPNIGVLGLTATPSRHDGEPLDFEHESYSVGFPDLIKKGLILKPHIRKIKSESSYSIDSLDEGSMEALNNSSRNASIANEIKNNLGDYRKIIVFVGTNNHAEALCAQLRQIEEISSCYESIDYIHSGRFSSSGERKTFIENQQSLERSIIVNVQMLTEGYDDSKINTVIMAAPSKSKLYYMQAVGRAIRMNEDDLLKKSYVVEIEERLPNIQYRIDNRWLFSDISDAIEPDVLDRIYANKQEFEERFVEMYEKHNVDKSVRTIPAYDEDQRYSLLIFREFKGEGKFSSLPLVMTRESRIKIRQMFNYISERISNYYDKGIHTSQVFISRAAKEAELSSVEQRIVYDAMKNAYETMGDKDHNISSFVKDGSPWVSFVSIRYEEKEQDIDAEIIDFLEEVINREELLRVIRAREYESSSVLLRVPLPLRGYVGMIVRDYECDLVDKMVSSLREIKCKDAYDHGADVARIIGEGNLPIQNKYINGLLLIAREEIKYFMRLGD
jgi:superfamily II DNA or RNA helicase